MTRIIPSNEAHLVNFKMTYKSQQYFYQQTKCKAVHSYRTGCTAKDFHIHCADVRLALILLGRPSCHTLLKTDRVTYPLFKAQPVTNGMGSTFTFTSPNTPLGFTTSLSQNGWARSYNHLPYAHESRTGIARWVKPFSWVYPHKFSATTNT